MSFYRIRTFHIRKSLAPVPILGQTNSIQISASTFPMNQIYIIFPYTASGLFPGVTVTRIFCVFHLCIRLFIVHIMPHTIASYSGSQVFEFRPRFFIIFLSSSSKIMVLYLKPGLHRFLSHPFSRPVIECYTICASGNLDK